MLRESPHQFVARVESKHIPWVLSPDWGTHGSFFACGQAGRLTLIALSSLGWNSLKGPGIYFCFKALWSFSYLNKNKIVHLWRHKWPIAVFTGHIKISYMKKKPPPVKQ